VEEIGKEDSPPSSCTKTFWNDGPVNQLSIGSVKIFAPFPNLNILSDNTSTKAEDAAGSGRRPYRCGSSSDNSLPSASQANEG